VQPAWLRHIDAGLLRTARQARKGVHGLGPGLITGAADDDPSGISTYTVTGASLGYSLLWMSLVTLPMNFAVQSICARIGIVSGRGLASVVGRRFGRRWLYPIVLLLFVANTVNIGADIGAIAAVLELLIPIPAVALVVPIGVGIALTEILVPYQAFAHYLKMMTLVIFAYVLGAFPAHPDWGAALAATFVPRMAFDAGTIQTVVAILGTTISPYLFFWQTSEEVEEDESRGIVLGRVPARRMRGLLTACHLDVLSGMTLANVGFYFVVLTSAATLYATGQRDIETAAEAAEALRPLAGDAAFLLFALGIIGTGLLAIPVLAGSVAYAAAELFGWREGLSNTLRRAPQFYAVLAAATLLGIGLNFVGLSAIKALFLAAIVNGVISPVMLVFVLLIARDRTVLGDFTTGRLISLLGWATTFAMAAAAIILVGSLGWP
jgi:NRAMP (natural resistance-associated macrophage protein)-like metal ion transporter